AAAWRWWSNECDRPEELRSEFAESRDVYSFADRLQAEGYVWAGKAGELYAEEDGFGWSIEVDRFVPVDDNDGPFGGEELMTRLAAVSLRFDFDEGLVETLKSVLRTARYR